MNMWNVRHQTSIKTMSRRPGRRAASAPFVLAPFVLRPSSRIMRPMSKNQDAKKNVKKAPSKTPKEKKEAKRLKKAAKG
jgi:hypothetical protein